MMQIKEAVLAALKEVVLPELATLKQEQGELKMGLALVNQRLDSTNQRLDSTNQRLDDVNAHLVDQSRRIDETNKRIDDVNKRFDDFSQRFDDVNKQFLALSHRIDAVRAELSLQLSDNNRRLDRLYEVIVRREEHEGLDTRVQNLERQVEELKRRLAA